MFFEELEKLFSMALQGTNVSKHIGISNDKFIVFMQKINEIFIDFSNAKNKLIESNLKLVVSVLQKDTQEED